MNVVEPQPRLPGGVFRIHYFGHSERHEQLRLPVLPVAVTVHVGHALFPRPLVDPRVAVHLSLPARTGETGGNLNQGRLGTPNPRRLGRVAVPLVERAPAQEHDPWLRPPVGQPEQGRRQDVPRLLHLDKPIANVCRQAHLPLVRGLRLHEGYQGLDLLVLLQHSLELLAVLQHRLIPWSHLQRLVARVHRILVLPGARVAHRENAVGPEGVVQGVDEEDGVRRLLQQSQLPEVNALPELPQPQKALGNTEIPVRQVRHEKDRLKVRANGPVVLPHLPETSGCVGHALPPLERKGILPPGVPGVPLRRLSPLPVGKELLGHVETGPQVVGILLQPVEEHRHDFSGPRLVPPRVDHLDIMVHIPDDKTLRHWDFVHWLFPMPDAVPPHQPLAYVDGAGIPVLVMGVVVEHPGPANVWPKTFQVWLELRPIPRLQQVVVVQPHDPVSRHMAKRLVPQGRHVRQGALVERKVVVLAPELRHHLFRVVLGVRVHHDQLVIEPLTACEHGAQLLGPIARNDGQTNREGHEVVPSCLTVSPSPVSHLTKPLPANCRALPMTAKSSGCLGRARSRFSLSEYM